MFPHQDTPHANGGLGRRESQGSVSSAGSLDLVSPRGHVDLWSLSEGLVTKCPHVQNLILWGQGVGLLNGARSRLLGGGGCSLDTKNISVLILKSFCFHSVTFFQTPITNKQKLCVTV